MRHTVNEGLHKLFHPRSVAFVGASDKPGKWGSIILGNLKRGDFQGTIYPINPAQDAVQGLKAYSRISDLPETPDLAVIVVPAEGVPGVVNECVAKGIKAGVVISAGFAELGKEGERLQREVVDRARAGGMVLVGPNCNGIMRPPAKLHLAMPPVFPPPGPIAVVTQSGNVGTSIVRRVMKMGFGVSCFVSSGNEADLHCEDYYRYLADDHETKVILSYIEGFRDGKRFLEVAREVTRKKPLIILKAGFTGAGAKAALSHTAALAGSDTAFNGAIRQAGVIRARNIDDLAQIGVGFIRQPLPRGRRVGIVTVGGGWGVLAADACSQAGLEVISLPDETIAELDRFMPSWWTRGNPVDLVAALRPDHLWNSLKCLLQCEQVDGLLLLGIMPALAVNPLTASTMPGVTGEWLQALVESIREAFERIMEMAESHRKPIIVASEFPTSALDLENRMAATLGKTGCVCYFTPEDAARVMADLASYAGYLDRVR